MCEKKAPTLRQGQENGNQQAQSTANVYTSQGKASMLDAALKWGKRGLPVFPCDPKNKSPLTANGFKDATTSLDQIKRWWEANPGAMIGLPTGQISGLWAVDLDGKEGIENFAKFCGSHGYTPTTTTQRTPSGGKHHLFSMPEGVSIPNSASKLAPKIDVRGDGGYIVVCPSQRADGKPYAWEAGTPPPAQAPAWLVELALAPKQQPYTPSPRQSPKRYEGNPTAYARAALEAECAVVANAPRGERNDTLNRAAFALGQLVGSGQLDETEVLAELERAAEACRLAQEGQAAVAKTIQSGLEKGKQQPREVPERAMQSPPPAATPPAWGEPVTFADHALPNPPAGALPPVLAEFCTTLAEELQVPFELPVAMSLAALAIAAQGRYVVQVREGHREELCLYICCPLEPGNRKSPCVARCAEPLAEYEIEAQAALKDTIASQRSERATLEKIIERKRATAAKINTAEERASLIEEIKELERELPTVENPPRLLADSVTPEALAALMEENGGRMGIMEAEGGLFQILAGQYSKGVPNLDLFLKSHDAETVRVDRKHSETVILHRPRLSIGLAPQPVVLTDHDARKIFRQRGVDARFLYFLPKSPLGHRIMEPAQQPPDVKIRYGQLIRRLLATTPPLDEYGNPEPYRLTLEKAALHTLLDFAAKVEAELDGGEYAGMTDWAGKLPGAVARLAGILHVAGEQCPHTTPIDKDTMEKAIALGVVFTQHSRAAYAMMGADPATEGAKRVLKWITSSRIETFTTQECWQAVRWSFHKMDPLKVALALLAERGYIAEIAQPVTVSKGGRPAAPVYTVNPATHRR